MKNRTARILTAGAVVVSSAFFSGCIDSLFSPTEGGSINQGMLRLGIKAGSSANALQKTGGYLNMNASISAVAFTSMKIVINEIEFEGATENDSLSFESEIPYVLDINPSNIVNAIDSLAIPMSGTFRAFKFKIDKLEHSDKDGVYAAHPELQEKSILIEGYVNDDPSQKFTFASSMDEEVEIDFGNPLQLSQQTITNVVFSLNVEQWFRSELGAFVDPRLESNKSIIENAIKKSMEVFEDRDEDGEDDELENETEDENVVQ